MICPPSLGDRVHLVWGGGTVEGVVTEIYLGVDGFFRVVLELLPGQISDGAITVAVDLKDVQSDG